MKVPLLLVGISCSGILRLSLLTVCVVTEVRTNANEKDAIESIVTLIVAPGVMKSGADVITGRVASDPLAFSR